MKRVWFVRHGQHDWIGKALVGRKPGVALNDLGRQQAAAIAARLRDVEIAAIYSSPQQRARETVEPLARLRGMPVRIDPALDEIDFGEWTGHSFEELAPDPRWTRWNAHRAAGVAPGGEAMRAVQSRIVRAVKALDTSASVVFVSHGDVIKAALLAFQGLSLDAVHTLSVEPGAMVYAEFGVDAPPTFVMHEPLSSDLSVATAAR
jgi:broad specificity phosphatase PhoE